MSRISDRPLLRLALIGAFVASLGLAACGRKGPLDPPPATLVNGEKAEPAGSKADKNHPIVGPKGTPRAPRGPEKRIPLDVLLN